MSFIGGSSWFCQRKLLLAFACYCCLLAQTNKVSALTFHNLDALNKGICGLSKPLTDKGSNRRGIGPRISSGWNATRGEFPWNVHITTRYSDYKKQVHFISCGGTIIHHNLILTAAHCVHWEHLHPADIFVIAGIMRGDGKNGTQRIIGERHCALSGYKFDKAERDLAVIRLESSIRYNDYVRPICLHDQTWREPSYRGCIFSGLGDMDDRLESWQYSRNLQGLSMEPCPRNVSQEIGTGEDEICMVTADKEHHPGNPCSGDSGGGLACLDSERNDGRYYLAGASSNWPGVCRPGEATPAYFASTWKLHYELLEVYDRCANSCPRI